MHSTILAIILATVFYAGQVLAGTNHEQIVVNSIAMDQPLFPEHNIFVPSWELEVHPGKGGPTMIFNGTINAAIRQMEEVNPNWKQEYADNQAKNTPISKRSEEDFRLGGCDVGDHLLWHSAESRPILDGVAYLRGKGGGDAPMGAGPRSCGRVSCSYDSGIWMCNDNPYPIITTWPTVGDGANVIANGCQLRTGNKMRVKGQAWHMRDNWNVIVRRLEGSNDPDSQGGHC